jgi:NAD-dependent dihydropyrimidine dehydrogenase PreA subunit
MFKPEVDKEKCIGCEECVDVCPSDVFEMQDDISVPVNPDECIGCEACIEACEQDAITITEIED